MSKDRKWLEQLVEDGNRFRNTPIVDDDFPAMRNQFDGTLDKATEYLKEQSNQMSFSEFSAINKKRCESPTGFNHKLSSWTLSDWFVAITGELGEAANIVKKINRYRDGIPGNNNTLEELQDKLKQEISDTFIYLDLASQAAGFLLGDVVMDTFIKKSDQLGYKE